MGIKVTTVDIREYTCERCGHFWRQRMPGQPDPLTLHGRVAWCRQQRWRSKHGFEAGIVFSQPERYDDPTFGRFSHFIAAQLLAKHV